MAETDDEGRCRALSEFIDEHRSALEAHAGGDTEAGWLAEALIEWARARNRTEGRDP